MHTKGYSDYLFAQPSLISGMARLLDLCGVYDSYNSSEKADFMATFADWYSVGQDVQSAIDIFEASMHPDTLTGSQYELFPIAR